MSEAPDEPRRYALRLLPSANRDRIEAAAWIAELVGEDAAQAWRSGVLAAVATLAENPRRFAVQERESRLPGREVRRLLYRRTPGSAAYHVFYTVAEDSPDGPRVSILHIRHAARRPLSRAEAREIRDEL